MKTPSIIAIMLGIFIVWSFIMEVDSGARSGGTITSVSDRQVISHLEGGVIKQVLVKEGQTVKKGQALVVVENLSFSEKRKKNFDIIASLSPKIERLKAELTQTEYNPILDDKYKKQQRALYLRRKSTLASEVSVLQNKIAQQQNEAGFLEKSNQLLVKEIGVLQVEFNTSKRLKKLGASSGDEVNKVQKSIIQADNRLNEVALNIAKSRQNIQRIHSEIKLKKDIFLDKTQEALDKATQQLDKAKTAYNIVKARETRSVLKAVEDGVVYKLWTPVKGMVTQAGRAIIEIATNDVNTEVISRVKIEDRDKIWINMDAKILITHWKLSSRPIAGKVVDISADSFTDEQTKEAYFKVTTLAKDVDDQTYKQLLVGMVVQVFYISGNHSIASYLVHPMSKGLNKIISEPVL